MRASAKTVLALILACSGQWAIKKPLKTVAFLLFMVGRGLPNNALVAA